jgi:hypothetical protein
MVACTLILQLTGLFPGRLFDLSNSQITYPQAAIGMFYIEETLEVNRVFGRGCLFLLSNNPWPD